MPAKLKPTGLSRTAFAKAQGVSKATVSKWEARGLPVHEGRIDVASGADWIAAHIEPRRPRRGPVPDSALSRLRSHKIEAENDLLDLERARKRGTLIDKAETLRALEDFGTIQREAWLGWVSRIVPELAAAVRSTDTTALFAALDKGVREHLADLARAPRPEFARNDR